MGLIFHQCVSILWWVQVPHLIMQSNIEKEFGKYVFLSYLATRDAGDLRTWRIHVFNANVSVLSLSDCELCPERLCFHPFPYVRGKGNAHSFDSYHKWVSLLYLLKFAVHKKFHGQDAHGQCSTNAEVHTLGRLRTILFLNLCKLEVMISCCIPHADAQTLQEWWNTQFCFYLPFFKTFAMY